MTRLLMVCRYFPPENKIGAVRPSRFAKYLAQSGNYKITVVAAMPYGMDCPEYEVTPDGIEIYRVNTGKGASLLHFKKSGQGAAVSSKISNSPQKKSFKHIIIGKLFRFRLLMEKNSMLRNAKKILRDNKKEFDVIFSTYNTEFGHIIAKWYKKHNKKVKWVADFRDSVWLSNSTPDQIKKAKKFAKDVAESCDIITVVSQGIIETHKDDFGDREVKVIYNGYDRDDIPNVTAKSDGILKMAYTGELYSGQRDLTPVFKALYKLSDEGKVDLSKVQIVYAGNGGGIFESQIAPFEKISFLNKGFVSRKEALQLQLESDVLLLSSWCYKGDKHTLTGKFFEYLGMNKPILSVIAGEETGCILTEMINNENLGFCYEEATKEVGFEKLCGYIEKIYKSFEENGEILHTPNKEFVDSFEYRNIIKEVDKLITRILNS